MCVTPRRWPEVLDGHVRGRNTNRNERIEEGGGATDSMKPTPAALPWIAEGASGACLEALPRAPVDLPGGITANNQPGPGGCICCGWDPERT